MTVLLIVLGVLLGLLLLISLIVLVDKAKIRIICRGDVKVVASVLGIRFTLYPEKKKQKKEPRFFFPCKDPDKILKRELKKQRKAAEKLQRKKKKARKKYAQKKAKQRKAAQPDPNLLENLQMVLHLIKRFYNTANGKATVEVRRMHLTVASDDAAKTAVLYGVIVQSAAYVLEWIDSHFARIKRKEGAMTVTPDYLSSTMTSDIDITLSLHLRRGLKIAVEMLSAYKEEKKLALKKAKKRVQSKVIQNNK